MKRSLPIAALLLAMAGGMIRAAAQQAPPEHPKLVVAIMVDQLRYDYLVRFRKHFEAGFARLLANGAVFTNAYLEHYPTVTAIGHATLLSGAKPGVSGIVGNDWFDRSLGKNVTSVVDFGEQRVGAAGEGASPRRMLVSTVGDELKMAGRGGSKVIGISIKDRSAILPAGHMADGAFWYDAKSGQFVSSTYYYKELPRWAAQFNDSRRTFKRVAESEWRSGLTGELLAKLPALGPKLYDGIVKTPGGNDLVAEFAQAAIEAEKLGQRGVTDLLAISFSSNDSVGHDEGPDSPQVADITIQTDRTLGRLFDFLDRTVGLSHIVFALSADHGVAPVPEVNTARGMPGGRMSSAALFDPIEAVLDARFGEAKWIQGTAGTSPYLDWALIAEKKLSPAEVRAVAAEAARKVPRVVRVYTRDQLIEGQAPPDVFSRRVAESYFPGRSGDLEILLEPYWMRSSSGTTHGTPYSYDAHVPLILMGPGIRPGRYHRNVALNDLAPTLATLLEIERPSGSTGRVLDEALE